MGAAVGDVEMSSYVALKAPQVLSSAFVHRALTTLQHCQMTDELMPEAAAVEMIALVAHSSRS